MTIKIGRYLFQFESFDDWCDTAKSQFKSAGVNGDECICLDAKKRICGWGRHFEQARQESAYPIKVYAIRKEPK